MTCTATGTSVDPGDADIYANVGTAVGTPVDDQGEALQLEPVQDQDASHYVATIGGIEVQKATNGADADDAPGPAVVEGETVTWTYEVTNIGELSLDSVTLVDSDPGVTPIFVGGDDGNGLLDPLETWTYSATGVAVPGQYENVATAEGQPVDADGSPAGEPVGASDPSHYIGVAKVMIGDFVWHDFDGDGLQNDGPTAPIGGVTVHLLDTAGNILETTATDAAGEYSFLVAPGMYVVEFVPVPGTVFTFQDQGPDDAADSDADRVTGRTGVITVANLDDLTIDAGLFIPAVLGDFVWHDFNGDGLQNDGPTSMLEGVQVDLLDSAGGVIGTQFTDAAGEYLFTDLVPGDYRVRFTAPDGTVFTMADAGANDAVDSDADQVSGESDVITLGSGDDNRTLDAGVFLPEKLGDFVWEDLDEDGTRDTGEPGVAGVTVSLLDDAGNVIGTTSTDSSGMYMFSDLAPASYQVRFELPDGFVFTSRDVGDDATDSDADPVSGDSHVVTLASGDVDLTIDAGLVQFDVGIDLVKLVAGEDAQTPTGPLLAVGDDVEFLFMVTNTGSLKLHDVQVTDDVFGLVCTIAELAPDDSAQCFINTSVLEGQHVNAATASGQPVDAQDNPIGGPVDDTDQGHYFGWFTGIEIEKATNGEDADAADGSDAPLIPVGETVTWTYEIANTGNVGLVGLTLIDDQLGSITCPSSSLPAETSMTCTATGVSVDQGDADFYANIGTVEATPVDDAGAPLQVDPVQDQDPSHYIATIGGLDVEKATNDEDADLEPGPVVLIGSTITWTYVVTNVGTVALADVTLDDSDASVDPVFVDGDDNGNGLLDLDEAWRYSAEGTATAGQYSNTATAGAQPVAPDGSPLGAPVDDADDSHYSAMAPLLIGDFVWEDIDGDGVQNDGLDSGIEGVTVRLLDAAGNVLAETTTDAAGIYQFEVLPGSYFVEVVVPAGGVFTGLNVGADDRIDSDVDPGTSRTGLITVTDSDDLTIDAGIVFPVKIGDFVWNDLNADGLQDDGEPGIEGVTVRLLDAEGVEIDSAVTDSTGMYMFMVTPGDYTVVFDRPGGFIPTLPEVGADETSDSNADPFDGQAPVTVLSGRDDFTIDAGFYEEASLGDFVWEDLDHDGLQGGGEPGIEGATVRLFDGAGMVLIATTVTDADGAYEFIGLPVGDYLVEFTPPVEIGLVLTASDAGDDALDSDPGDDGRTDVFTLTSGQHDPTWDAGFHKLIDLQIDKAAVPDNIGAFLDFDYVVTVSNLGPADATGVVLLDLMPARVVGSDPPLAAPFDAFPCFGDYVDGGGSGQNCIGDASFQIDTPAFGSMEPLDHPSERGTDEIAPGVLAPQSVDILGASGPGVTCTIDESVHGVRCDIGDLAAGESVVIMMPVTAHPLDRVRVWNRAWVFGAEFEENLDKTDATQPCVTESGSGFGDRGVGCNYVKKNEVINAEIDLGILKTASTGTIDQGEAFSYTLDIVNNGPFAAAAVYAVDTLPAGVEFVSADDGCVYDAGSHTIECQVGLMMPGDATARTISVAAAADATGTLVNIIVVENRENPDTAPIDTDASNDMDTAETVVLVGVIGDTIWLDSNRNGVQDEGEPGIPGIVVSLIGDGVDQTAITDGDGTYLFVEILPGDYEVAVDTTSAPDGFELTTAEEFLVMLGSGEAFLDADFGFAPDVPVIDLEVTKAVTPTAVIVGETAVFTISVTNQGPDDATGVELTDVMPPEFPILTALGTGSFAGGTWTVGELPAGATATLRLTVTAEAAGAFTNVVEVSAAEQLDLDSIPGDGEGDDYAIATLGVAQVLASTLATTTTTAADVLPKTGLEIGQFVAFGLILFGFGLLVVITLRRREEEPPTE